MPKKHNDKKCSNYWTIALISHASKVMLKILQVKLQQYVNKELPDVQDGFRKGRGTRDQIAKICWIIEKARDFQKNIYFCFIDYSKAFDCVNHNKLWKILKIWECQTTLPTSWETCMEGKLAPNWERSTSGLYIFTLLIWLPWRVHHAKCRAGWSSSWNQDCR